MKTIIFLFIILFACDVESFKLKNVLKKIVRETWRGMKNGPSQSRQTPNWSNERIIRAEHAQRPLEGNLRNIIPVDHHGIVLHTSFGNSYLLHNTPNSGVVITDAIHMSNNWNINHDIPINNQKTVGEALHSAGSSSFGQEKCGYIKGGTCIGTANSVEDYLKK